MSTELTTEISDPFSNFLKSLLSVKADVECVKRDGKNHILNIHWAKYINYNTNTFSLLGKIQCFQHFRPATSF